MMTLMTRWSKLEVEMDSMHFVCTISCDYAITRPYDYRRQQHNAIHDHLMQSIHHQFIADTLLSIYVVYILTREMQCSMCEAFSSQLDPYQCWPVSVHSL